MRLQSKTTIFTEFLNSVIKASTTKKTKRMEDLLRQILPNQTQILTLCSFENFKHFEHNFKYFKSCEINFIQIHQDS